MKDVQLTYLDTNVWNLLLNQNIQTEGFCTAINRACGQLTISGQVVYELARSFKGKRCQSPERGRKLFSYVNGYIERNIPCFHDTSRFLSQEAKRAVGEITRLEIFFNVRDYAVLKAEITRLTGGRLEHEAETFIRERRRKRDRLREVLNSPPTHPGNIIDIARRCSYYEFLGKVSPTYKRQVLKQFLRNQFPNQTPQQLTWVSKRLLASSDNLFTQSLIRSSLYLGWRRANGQVASRDLPDDYYHVLNAAYSQIYATAERKQEQYAPLFLSETQVEIYPGSGAVDEWLLSLLS